MRVFSFSIFIFLLLSCTDGRDEVIEHFYAFYDDILNRRFEKVSAGLNDESKQFMSELTSLSGYTYEEVSKIGRKYKIEDLLMNYVLEYKEELKVNNSDSSFYYYLSLKGVPLFDFTWLYHANKDRTRIDPDAYIAIYREAAESNYLSWIKFERAEVLKYDLIYMLQFANRKQKKIYDVSLRTGIAKNLEELYAKIDATDGSLRMNYDFIKDQVAERNKRVLAAKTLKESGVE